jgi:hypothetical protein
VWWHLRWWGWIGMQDHAGGYDPGPGVMATIALPRCIRINPGGDDFDVISKTATPLG